MPVPALSQACTLHSQLTVSYVFLCRCQPCWLLCILLAPIQCLPALQFSNAGKSLTVSEDEGGVARARQVGCSL